MTETSYGFTIMNIINVVYVVGTLIDMIFEIKQKPSTALEIDRTKAYKQIAATNECCDYVRLTLTR